MLCQFLLYNKVNQLYVYTYPLIPSLWHLPPTSLSHHSRLSQSTEPVLCGCFPLAIHFAFSSVYMSMPLSHFVPAYPSPSPCHQVHSLCLHLYSCPATRFFSTIFLDSIYLHQHTVFGFLFLTSLCMTDSRSIHLITNNNFVPFYEEQAF